VQNMGSNRNMVSKPYIDPSDVIGVFVYDMQTTYAEYGLQT